MQSDEKKALKSIGKDERFSNVIEQLTVGKILSQNDRSYILASAILLIRHYQQDQRFTSYADLAYYIILKYSVQHEDYTPLYDFAVNFGFYPIAKSILSNSLYQGNLISNCLGDIKLDRFRNKGEDTLTLEQHIASTAFLNETAYETCYLAPTSFGKSSLIVDQIKRLENLPRRIAILVPTKSLLIQTLQMIRAANLQRKIMIHDEMYGGENSFIAVFTQERALRLLTKNTTCFDVIFVDEAHNLLKNDGRSILLSRVIAKNRVLNPVHRVYYFSPLLQDANNLRLKPDQNISSHIVKFNVKEPEIFELRLNRDVYQFNRFLNKTYKLQEGVALKDYLLANSGEKNFIYNYRPKNVELLAGEICKMIPQTNPTDEIAEVAHILANEVHPDFYAIEHLKHGVVYLHGKLPDIVKEYLEYKYKTLTELKYIVANSVILEGMNLPIDTLFIFNTRLLYGKELMNLIGRVNRLNTIFGQAGNQLKRLLPKVHFINNEEHNRLGSKMENKIALLRSRVFDDEIKNPTLEAYDIEDLHIPVASKEKYVEKMSAIQENERFLTAAPEKKEDKLRAYLIQSGIIEFYSDPAKVILRFITESPALTTNPPESWINAPMMEKIEYLFLKGIDDITDFEVRRLIQAEARSYYETHILVAQKKSLHENINSQIQYFKKKAATDDNKMYFGKSYGEESYESAEYPASTNKTHVNLANKNDRQLANLALVKLKMEDDFVSFKINKFIVMLFDYGFISTNEYNKYIYGTTDEQKIRLTKYGLSVGMISKLEKDNQLHNLEFDEFNNLRAKPAFDEFLLTVNDFYKFEIRRYIG